MKMKDSIKSVSATFMIISSMTLVGCATDDIMNTVSDGNAMSTTQTKLKSVNQNKVRLFYSSYETPRHYKIVGRVSAENYNMVGMEHTQASIAEELKKQAASIGANGVININSGLAQTTGDAIRIN